MKITDTKIQGYTGNGFIENVYGSGFKGNAKAIEDEYRRFSCCKHNISITVWSDEYASLLVTYKNPNC